VTSGELERAYSIGQLGKEHDRRAFGCGHPSLDRYLREQASQDARRHVAATFVAVPREMRVVVGYCSLSATSLDVGDLPPEVARKLPRYRVLPATLLGRLAVDRTHQRRGLGEYLLLHALSRSLARAEQVASYAVIVDAIDQGARSFYERFEFIPLLDRPLRLYLPTASIVRRLER